jgi:hypothetical protein
MRATGIAANMDGGKAEQSDQVADRRSARQRRTFGLAVTPDFLDDFAVGRSRASYECRRHASLTELLDQAGKVLRGPPLRLPPRTRVDEHEWLTHARLCQ